MINKDELQDEMGDNHIASSAKTSKRMHLTLLMKKLKIKKDVENIY
jgi:hypothetical protein